MKITFLHKIIALAFTMSLLVNMILPSLVFVDFKINQKFIAANLCVEKDIKESTCEGRCQLSKSLSKIEQNKPVDNNQLEVNVESHITSIFLEKVFEFQFIFQETKINYNVVDFNLFDSGINDKMFRPPILS